MFVSIIPFLLMLVTKLPSLAVSCYKFIGAPVFCWCTPWSFPSLASAQRIYSISYRAHLSCFLLRTFFVLPVNLKWTTLTHMTLLSHLCLFPPHYQFYFPHWLPHETSIKLYLLSYLLKFGWIIAVYGCRIVYCMKKTHTSIWSLLWVFLLDTCTILWQFC